ncbi:DUF3576 domain-containing protein [Pelagibacteraceae bacterium]|jgi:hypothetical protein|nr:DUF3576 domain-containing protein [Pelagibacteraceae bacterium]|tara:strand:- start:1151 stop:1729 length:579 start_codon:yes stop_codon:yes gene_type:complete
MKKFTLLSLIILLTFSGCSRNIFKRADVKDTPVNVNDRVQKNIAEGRGIRFGKNSSNKGGTFDFASSNALWRASMDTLDFVPFSNASYSGGILITEWFDGNSKIDGENRELKITVRFLTNEVRADALGVSIHEKKCTNNYNNCNIIKIKSKLETEIKLAILKRAALIDKKTAEEYAEEFKKQGRSVFKKGGK